MRHLACYYSSISNAAALQQIAALADGLLQIRDSAFVLAGGLRQVVAVRGFGVNLTRLQLQPPSIRGMGFYEVKPFQNAVGVGDQIETYLDLHDEPLILDPGEELPVYATQGSAGAQDAYCFLDLSDGKQANPSGKPITVRATGTTTLTAKAWTSCALTFDNPLPNRKFELVGARMKGASALAFRFIFPGNPWRPGAFAHQSDLVTMLPGYRRGRFGIWAEFDYLTIPSVEVLATAADTAQTVELDLIQL